MCLRESNEYIAVIDEKKRHSKKVEIFSNQQFQNLFRSDENDDPPKALYD